MSTTTLTKISYEAPIAAGGGNYVYPPHRELSQESSDDNRYLKSMQMLGQAGISSEDFDFADIIARNYEPAKLEVALAAGSAALLAETSSSDSLPV